MWTQNRPDPDLEVPEAVLTAADGDTITAVWRNDAGGTTYRLGDGPTRRFAKWAPLGSGLDLHAEEMRLRWVVDFTPAPIFHTYAKCGGKYCKVIIDCGSCINVVSASTVGRLGMLVIPLP